MVTVQGICEVSPEEETEGYGGKDLLKKVLSFDWKSEGEKDNQGYETTEEEVSVIGKCELQPVYTRTHACTHAHTHTRTYQFITLWASTFLDLSW